MDWKDIAGSIADLGLPILGAAFGVPGPVTTFAAKLVKKALGLPASATADDVNDTIAGMDPEVARTALEGAQSEVQAKYAFLTAAVEAAARVNEKNITEVNKTIRAEIGKVSWWHWRHLLGYVVGFEILVFPMAALATITLGSAEQSKAMIDYSGQLTIILGIAAGLLGYVALDNTNRQALAATGEKPDGVIVSTAKALAGRKK